MLQAKATLVLVSLLALGATGCGHRMSRRHRVMHVPVYVPTVVIYQGSNPYAAEAARNAQVRAEQEAAAQEAAAQEAAEVERRAQEQAAREAAAREVAARAAAAAAEREAEARAQAEAAARARAAQAAQGATTIIIVGPGGAPPTHPNARQAAPGVWISNE